MIHSRNHRQSPLAPFPGQPAPRPYDRGVETACTRLWSFFAIPTGRGLSRSL